MTRRTPKARDLSRRPGCPAYLPPRLTNSYRRCGRAGSRNPHGEFTPGQKLKAQHEDIFSNCAELPKAVQACIYPLVAKHVHKPCRHTWWGALASCKTSAFL